MEFLVQPAGGGGGQTLRRVGKPSAWIGRDGACDVRLDAPFVSSRHALVECEDDAYFITSIGLNGTFCNALDLEKGRRYRIKAGDRIRIAGFELVLGGGAERAAETDLEFAAMMRRVMDVEHRLHADLLRRLDLRTFKFGTSDPVEMQRIREHLDRTVEQEVDRIDRDLHGFVERLALRRELLAFIDHGGRERPADAVSDARVHGKNPAHERAIREVVSRLSHSSGLELTRHRRRADLDRLEKHFERHVKAANIAGSPLLGRYLVKRWFTKDLGDIIFGFGPLQDLLELSSVSEIMVVRRDQIYVELGGVIEDSGRSFLSDEMVIAVLERIVSPLGRRIDRSTPLVDARLPDGSRVNAIIPPLAVSGPCITIRKFSRRPLSIEDLIASGAMTEQVATFLRACVLGRRNVIVSGGTGSGKTTLLNVLSSFIPPEERIVTIEDSAELQLVQKHVVTLEARPANVEGSGEYTIRDLVRNALRMRPDRIVVGECRGGEALDMLQAMNTGHDGSMTTGHANSPADMILRLETMVLTGAEMPIAAIRQQIAAALDVIVQLERFADGRRRVTGIAEVVGVDRDDGQVIVEAIFSGPDEGGDHDLVHSGYIPTFAEDMVSRGILPLSAWFG